MDPPPSGSQHEIAHGPQRAVIVEVGGGIREYEVAGRPVLESYAPGAVRDGAHGTPLVPWPNRIRDGRYRFDGVDHQLALTEPDKHNAIHGLLTWRPWRAVDRGPAHVAMTTRLHPMTGYPFALDVTVRYELGAAGLSVTMEATNTGDRACPFGAGQHPYLSPGAAPIDECLLHLEAATRILTDEERQLPVGREPTRGTEFDFGAARRIGDLRIDHAFTDLARDADGRAWVRLAAPDGATAELWVDERHPYVEIYTGDALAEARRRRGLGAEPMTCPPDAFRSGEGVARLEPGQSYASQWGARLVV
jgi:aldose 1-epimerase